MDQELQPQEPEVQQKPETTDEEELQRVSAIHAVKSFLLALIILVVAIVLMIVLVLTKKDPETKELTELVTTVRVQTIVPAEHQVRIETQGAVRSLREVTLSAEVRGRVVTKSANLVAGGTVRKGQMLVELEAADYKAAEARAKSAVAEAKLALDQEQAMSEQAASDWRKLGRGEASDLMLRKPQLAAAAARLESAEAELLRAQRDVERTVIRAPFDARVRAAMVEVGAVLAPGTPVAELYSPEELEVRLPFSLLDYGFLKESADTTFTLTASVGGEIRSWPAVLDRIDGEVQRSTLSAYGLARIEPDAQGDLPPVGLFVEAEVPGQRLEEVVMLPRSAVRGRDEVWVAREGRLAKCVVTILRSTATELVVRGEFEAGDQLVLTRLAAPMVGMKVEIKDEGREQP